MIKTDSKYFCEIRRLASLLLEFVNTAEICLSKLRDGFVEKTDVSETAKTIKRLHSEILQLDSAADDALNGKDINKKS